MTGAAGFVGFHLVRQLSHNGHVVVGLDGLNEHYDINLKYGRLSVAGVAKELIAYGKRDKQ